MTIKTLEQQIKDLGDKIVTIKSNIGIEKKLKAQMMENIVLIGECTEQQRLLLAQNLKTLNKITCFTGESIADCFAIEESDVGVTMSNHGVQYCLRVCDLAVENDVMLIYESIKMGRTIYENMRKYIQY